MLGNSQLKHVQLLIMINSDPEPDPKNQIRIRSEFWTGTLKEQLF
jgi:hypothetical protein